MANTFEIPFRRSTPLSLSDAIKSYISSKYEQHPDMFKNDLQEIDMLRMDAINVIEPHVSGLMKLGKYAAQLRWIMGKFPIDIGAEFTWYMALGYNLQSPVIQNNLQFEWANVLYNLASLYSGLAASSTRTTTEGLKAACNYYTSAAGVIKYLQEEVIPELRSPPPEDMDSMSLEALEQLMLAQAQECFWQKAVTDGNRDVVVARLAEQVSEFYRAAEEFGTKGNAVPAEWIHRISAKQYHLAAAAQYRASRDCLERSKYGEEITRLQVALSHVKLAVVEGRYLNRAYLADLMGFQSKLLEELKRANKDNDMIYLSPIPPVSSLPPIKKATGPKSNIPKEITEASNWLTHSGPYGPPLFAKLVPFAVHLATSIYEEKRDKLNTDIIGELETLTTKLHELLQSLNLPGSLQALEKPLGLPQGLLAHAEEIRQQNGLPRILRSIDDIAKLKANNHAMYKEATDMLASEETTDRLLREKHGTIQWTRPASRLAAPHLHKELEEYAGYMESAAQSDILVKDKVKTHEDVLKVLGSDKNDVEAFVPDTQRVKMTPKLEREVAKLRSCLNEVSRLESRRRRNIEAIKEKARTDDITSDILQETARLERNSPQTKIEPFHFEALFETRLSTRYSVELNSLQDEFLEQSRLESRLREANTGFTNMRKLDTSTLEREAALQALENGYFKYREIVQNLETGRKFYNDLGKLLARLRETVKGWCLERMSEAKTLESDLVASVEALRIYDRKKDMGIRTGAVRRQSADMAVELKTPQPALSPSEPTRQFRISPTMTYQQQPAQVSQKVVTPSPPRQTPRPVRTGDPSTMKYQQQPAQLSQKVVTPSSPKQTARPVRTGDPSSLPPTTPTLARVVSLPQNTPPRPGLWTGDGMTPIWFAGESSETNRRGSTKR